MTQEYDIIVFGAGIAGLYLANRLLRTGYNVILIEKDCIGGTQTLASQGMIHGGQKYVLSGKVTAQAEAVAAMTARWDACFDGVGDIDLSNVRHLSDSHIMFPAGLSFIGRFLVFAAAQTVNSRTRKMKRADHPEGIKGPVYELQEKVVEVKSLVAVLAKNLQGRIFKGAAQELLPDGQVAVDGVAMKAQAVIFTAGTGNEEALRLLNVKEKHTQRRPLRQIMVRPMPYALYGHGITGKPRPRVTVTSHEDASGHYVWYLGGNVAEEGAKMDEADALSFAKHEMQEIFPAIGWSEKEWASFAVDRAEAFDEVGQLPPGPVIQQRGQVLVTWPTKMTLAPALSDNIFAWLERGGIRPAHLTSPPALPELDAVGLYPWESAAWHRL